VPNKFWVQRIRVIIIKIKIIQEVIMPIMPIMLPRLKKLPVRRKRLVVLKSPMTKKPKKLFRTKSL
jgi:hypothetical protein